MPKNGMTELCGSWVFNFLRNLCVDFFFNGYTSFCSQQQQLRAPLSPPPCVLLSVVGKEFPYPIHSEPGLSFISHIWHQMWLKLMLSIRMVIFLYSSKNHIEKLSLTKDTPNLSGYSWHPKLPKGSLTSNMKRERHILMCLHLYV